MLIGNSNIIRCANVVDVLSLFCCGTTASQFTIASEGNLLVDF